MKIELISTSHPGYEASKEEFEFFSGKAAGVCYMPNNYQSIACEDRQKTIKRIEMTKNNGHHSVYDHNSISLYLEDVPKIIAMLLNNEKMYTTSEKSARYTKMNLNDDEKILFQKWLSIFKQLIGDKYKQKYQLFFSDSRIEKLAQENARYLISVFTPTSMVYTTTYRQLNYLYGFIIKETQKEVNDDFSKKLQESLKEFSSLLKTLPYIDDNLRSDGKNRSFSLIGYKTDIEEHFGDVYSASYKSSFAYLAQAQRHRTISYNFSLLEKNEYFIPPILNENPSLIGEWLADCEKQANQFPQGLLIKINEFGTLDNFILKMLERNCSYAQLEINQQTTLILKRYLSELKSKNHPRANELSKYTRGARCTFPNYKCSSLCHFQDGILQTRII